MLARATIIGNLGQDPEIKEIATGGKLARFSLAVNKVSKGEKSTTWFNIVCFDEKKIEVLQNYARKGTRLYVEGDLSTRTYTDKNGIEKLAVEVVVGRFDGRLLLVSSRDDGAATPQQSNGGASKPWDDLDDDIPGFD